MVRFPAVAPIVFSVVVLLGLQFTVSSSSLAEINQDSTKSAAARNLKQGQEHPHEVHCSRERSRAARQIIEEYLMPFVKREKFQMSSLCKLHPDNDMFRDQEEHKIHVDINEWRCGYCKKSFRAEKFLDQHFDNRHYNLLNVSLADGCFPVNQGLSASQLHELFLHQFCDAHTCSEKKRPFPRGGLKQPNILYLATSILTLMLLPVLYLIVYLHRRDMRGKQELKRITKRTKPS
ncbi:uncharacterized protein LOC115749560 isoform X2 [Rhodamnia argentea]|uniref:Uncharacterized protein LOC115749560 isoform X2 n=1 Tax=Rhodamnia argentea TaxID=178133 RepID=A0ABM3HM23_9MYRT|nr:uncharacterized protein LOC115749560 isoform X2 [Rhodamnia argentea]